MKSSNTNFMDNNKVRFLDDIKKGRKLILFGAGNEMNKVFEKIIIPNKLKVDYIVDNDFRKWNSKYWGINIKEPSCIEDEDKENIIVLITSIYPYRIEPQLIRLGVKNYYSSLLFLDEHIGKQQFMIVF